MLYTKPGKTKSQRLNVKCLLVSYTSGKCWVSKIKIRNKICYCQNLKKTFITFLKLGQIMWKSLFLLYSLVYFRLKHGIGADQDFFMLYPLVQIRRVRGWFTPWKTGIYARAGTIRSAADTIRIRYGPCRYDTYSIRYTCTRLRKIHSPARICVCTPRSGE